MTDVSESAYYSVVSLTPRRPLKSPRCPQRHRRPANLLWPSVPPDYPSRQILVTFRTKKLHRKEMRPVHGPAHRNDIGASRSPWYRRLERSPNLVLSTQYSLLHALNPENCTASLHHRLQRRTNDK